MYGTGGGAPRRVLMDAGEMGQGEDRGQQDFSGEEPGEPVGEAPRGPGPLSPTSRV